MRRPSRWGLDPDEIILREGRNHPPLRYWILVPLACGTAFGVIVSRSSFEPGQWPFMAAFTALLGLFFVKSSHSWQWRITTTHLQQGYLGWPIYRFDSRAALAGFTSVTVLTGKGVHREVTVHLGDGMLRRWHRGVVLARLRETADVKMVFGTDTEAEAEELGAFLRARVEEAQRIRGYVRPPDHNMRLLPNAPDPDQPS